MSFLAILFLAFAMSTDAFAVAICRGMSLKTAHFFDALKVGILFGVIEAITPLLGWFLGYIAQQYIEKWDHWVVFVVMLFLGARMIYNAFQADQEPCQQDDLSSSKSSKSAFLVLIFTAISTSIDAFAVGVGLALASVNIYFASVMIGAATCIMVTIGLLLGKKIGCVIGKKAEFLGGIVLISIGIITLYPHL